MALFRSDIIKILDRLDQINNQREKEFNSRIKKGKPLIEYRVDNMNEAKALVALMYLSKLPLKNLLSLTSDDYIIRNKELIIMRGLNVRVPVNYDDKVFTASWDHLKTISPNCYVFAELKDNPSLYYYINKWLRCLNKKVTVKDLYT